jgi:hypothetical protein
MTPLPANSPSDSDFARLEHIQSLVDRSRELLSVELKDWFDPQTIEGVAKLVRAALALRNQNGGYLVIGFDDKTREPTNPAASLVGITSRFNQDTIQGIISKYASQTFEIALDFPIRDEHQFVVISIPPGVTMPVACRADLRSGNDFLLRESETYVRTLTSNGTISSARASWRDMDMLMRRCFENRESDYGRLLLKAFTGISPNDVKAVFQNLSLAAEQGISAGVSAEEIIDQGAERFSIVATERGVVLPTIGYWDIGLRISGPMPEQVPNRKFLELITASNPHLTGWPIWLNSSSFANASAHPYLFDGRWEAFIYSPSEDRWGAWGHLDFTVFDPKGNFFLRRGFQDDIGGSSADTRGKTVDPLIQILRIAESLVVAQAFAKAMGCSEEETTLHFAFRWIGLKGRVLTTWSDPMWSVDGDGPAHQDQVRSKTNLALAAGREAIIQRTHEAILPLSRIFGGYELKEELVRKLVTRLLDRKL